MTLDNNQEIRQALDTLTEAAKNDSEFLRMMLEEDGRYIQLKTLLALSGEKLFAHTPFSARIRNWTEAEIARYADAGSDAIERRLYQLDQEWDTDRVVQADAAALMLLGVVGSRIFGRRRMVLVSLLAAWSLAAQAIEGASPLMPLLRLFGVRTRREIEEERYALKFIRGDFRGLPEGGPVSISQSSRILNALDR